MLLDNVPDVGAEFVPDVPGTPSQTRLRAVVDPSIESDVMS